MAPEAKRMWKDSQGERSGGQRSGEEKEQSVPGKGSLGKKTWSMLGPADPDPWL